MQNSSPPHPAPLQDAKDATTSAPTLQPPVAISRASATALWHDNSTSPVTDWFDADGDDADPATATTCVTQDPNGLWWALDLEPYTPTALH